MALFENFPYTNFHEMNLDYLLKRVKELEEEVANLAAHIEDGPVNDVKMFNNGAWLSVVDSFGDAEIAKATPLLYGTVKVESSNDLGARKMKIHADGQYDTLPTLDANDHIDAGAIPASGVTAGTYGQTTPSATGYWMNTPCFTVDPDGRITNAQQRQDRIYRTAYGTIAAGSSTTSLYFNLANGPWYNNGSGFNVDLFEVTTTGKGDPMLVPLVLGTDYNYNITKGSSSIAVSPTLTATKSNPVAVVVNGSYGEYHVM